MIFPSPEDIGIKSYPVVQNPHDPGYRLLIGLHDNPFGPGVFPSVPQALLNNPVNGHYLLGRDLQSLDIPTKFHRHLVRGLKIPDIALDLPLQYFLSKRRGPQIIDEPTYLLQAKAGIPHQVWQERQYILPPVQTLLAAFQSQG
jgi:hypothetical protein